ncbi:TPA: hypothetical protein N0F65_007742, partial [Lagenidium giganteum]
MGAEEGGAGAMRRSTRERKKPKEIYAVEDPRDSKDASSDDENERNEEDDDHEEGDDENDGGDGEEEGDGDEQEDDEEGKQTRKRGAKGAAATAAAGKKRAAAASARPRAKKTALVKPRKLRPVKEGNEDDEQEAEAEDDENTLFEAIKRGKCSIRNLLIEWRDRYETSEEDGTREILNFVLQACGGVGQCVPTTEKLEQLDMSDLVDYVVEDLAQSQEDYPIAPKAKQHKRFYRNFVDFWDTFVKESVESELLFTSELISQFVDWLTTLSSAEVRAIRHTTTVAAYALGSALVEAASSLDEKLSVAKRQLNAEVSAQKKASAKGSSTKRNSARTTSKKMEQLQANKKMYEERLQQVLQLINSLFTGVIVHRYRDVMHEIRIESVETLGSWIEALPGHFLKDNYLKYLGWMLNDKHESVRYADVEMLRQLYENEAFTKKIELFTSRFLPRFLELCNDVDDDVVHSCIRLLIAVDKRSLISSDVDLQSVEKLVFDESNEEIRKAAAEFVCLQYDAFGVAESTTTAKLKKEQLNTQAIALVEFAEEYIKNHQVPPDAVKTLVDAFWGLEDCQVLQDWQLLTNLLLVDNAELTGDQLTILIRLLLAAVRKIVDDDSSASKKKSNEKGEIAVAFCKELPNLLVRFQSDAEKLTLLVELVPLISLSSESIGQHLGHVKGLLEKLKHAYLSHAEEKLLKVLALSITHLYRAPYDPVKREAEVIVHEVFQTILDKTLQLLRDDSAAFEARHAASAEEPSTSKSKRRSSKSRDMADLEYALRMHLCRLKCLSQHLNMRDYLSIAPSSSPRASPPKTAERDEEAQEEQVVAHVDNLGPAIMELLQRRTKAILQLNAEFRHADTIKYALTILYSDLLWLAKPVFNKLESSNPSDTALDSIEGKNAAREQMGKITRGRGLLEDALVSILEMHLEKTQRTEADVDEEEKVTEDSEEPDSEQTHMQEISLEDEAVATYVKEAQRAAFLFFCDTRCLFVEKFRDAPAPYDGLEWVLPKILVLLTQMYFENEMQAIDTAVQEQEEKEEEEAVENDKIQQLQAHKIEMLVALGRASMCNPSNKRQAAAIMSYLTDQDKESFEVVKAFSKQVKAEAPIRHLEIQMTALRQLFGSIMTMKAELTSLAGEEDEESQATYEELEETIVNAEAELRDLSKKLSQSLGVGKVQSSLRPPFFRFICEGVRFSLEIPEQFEFLECMRPYVSHLDRSSTKQLKAFFDHMLEEMSDVPQEDDELDNSWRTVFEFKDALSPGETRAKKLSKKKSETEDGDADDQTEQPDGRGVKQTRKSPKAKSQPSKKTEVVKSTAIGSRKSKRLRATELEDDDPEDADGNKDEDRDGEESTVDGTRSCDEHVSKKQKTEATSDTEAVDDEEERTNQDDEEMDDTQHSQEAAESEQETQELRQDSEKPAGEDEGHDRTSAETTESSSSRGRRQMRRGRSSLNEAAPSTETTVNEENGSDKEEDEEEPM